MNFAGPLWAVSKSAVQTCRRGGRLLIAALVFLPFNLAHDIARNSFPARDYVMNYSEYRQSTP